VWRPESGWPWRRKTSALVRLAKSEVSLLSRDEDGWKVSQTAPCDGGTLRQAAALRHAIQVVATAAPASVTVLCDSCWLPLCLVRTGAKPLSIRQVHALARHRLHDIYGAESARWSIEVDYVPGDELALAFGLPAVVNDAIAPLRDTLEGSGRKVFVQPTLAWVWNEIWRKQALPADAWLVLAEQDRAIALARQAGKLAALQTAGSALANQAKIRQLAGTEMNRFGLEGDCPPVHGFSFEPFVEMRMAINQADLHWQILAAGGVRA
jgi:hypothetical protein